MSNHGYPRPDPRLPQAMGKLNPFAVASIALVIVVVVAVVIMTYI